MLAGVYIIIIANPQPHKKNRACLIIKQALSYYLSIDY